MLNLLAAYSAGLFLTWTGARRLRQHQPNDPTGAILYPGWPLLWTAVATFYAGLLIQKQCAAMTSLYLMSWLFLWPPVLTTLMMATVAYAAHHARKQWSTTAGKLVTNTTQP